MRCSMLVTLTVVAITASGCVASDTAGRGQFARYTPALDAAAARTEMSLPEPIISDRSVAPVQKFVQTHAPSLQLCYQESAIRNTAVAGTAKLEVTLAEDGYVLRVRVLERAWEGDGSAMEECVLANVRRWKFPETGPFDQYIHSFSVKLGPEQTSVARR